MQKMYILLLVLVCIRKSAYLRLLLRDKLYYVGIQLGHTIYTAVGDVYQETPRYDIVLLWRTKVWHAYRLFSHEYVTMPVCHPSPMQTLQYLVDGKPRELMYLEGTPFRVRTGELVLYQRKRRGLCFVKEQVARGDRWPLW